jgi:uncharacterized membrane protein YfcA
MDIESLILLVLIFITALLYSSVGHAGASGYLAAMALMGISPAIMKPTALCLNILVATIATFKFYRVGAFSWRLFLPLAIPAIPLAYIGGLITLQSHIYKPIIGVVLLYAAAYSFKTANKSIIYPIHTVSAFPLLLLGAILGFLSGLTGVGGGIFLSPLLLFFRWAEMKSISGIAAAFILINSIAGLSGVLSKTATLPSALPLWAIGVIIGGFIGAEYGSKHFGNATIQKLLALVLVIAGIKMIASV